MMTTTEKPPIWFPEPVPVLLQTTPRLLREAGACADGYRKAVKARPGALDDPEQPMSLLGILESNGLDDFFWASAHVLPGQEADRDRAFRLMAAEFAAKALPLFETERPDDERPRRAIEAARDYALGKIDAAARGAARAAAGAAAWAAAGAAAGGEQRAIVRRYLKGE